MKLRHLKRSETAKKTLCGVEASTNHVDPLWSDCVDCQRNATDEVLIEDDWAIWTAAK